MFVGMPEDLPAYNEKLQFDSSQTTQIPNRGRVASNGDGTTDEHQGQLDQAMRAVGRKASKLFQSGGMTQEKAGILLTKIQEYSDLGAAHNGATRRIARQLTSMTGCEVEI